ncbi:MAG TPA: WD40 repeat domain-containing protein [Gemmataceae bacterium]|jgi:WD40 repeat protein|nr:WD40 repeat domain-containing protein [Gemmataceae bacterium]
MLVLTGHTDPVNQVVFSPDGRTLASAGDDGCIWLWDTAKQRAKARISWGARFVFALAFSPDGRVLAAGTEDSLLLLNEDGQTWKAVQRWRDHKAWVTAVAFSRDGQVLASGGWDGSLKLWDAQQYRRKPLQSFTVTSTNVRTVAFSPDNMTVAAAGGTNVGLWRATENEPLLFQRLRDADVRSVAFSPDGQVLAVAAGRAVLLLDPFKQRSVELLTGPADYFRSLVFCPDGQGFAAGRTDGSVLFWDARTGHESKVYEWQTGTVNSVALSPDGLTAACAGDDFTVCVWEL